MEALDLGKKSLFSLIINHQLDIHKIYLWNYKSSKWSKISTFNLKSKDVGTIFFNDSKAFIQYSNDMKNSCKNIEEYNPNKKRKILIVFNNTIADVLSNEKN